jgi:hypothetical protein
MDLYQKGQGKFSAVRDQMQVQSYSLKCNDKYKDLIEAIE